MSELVLITTPEQFHDQNNKLVLEADRVIGMTAPQSATVMEHGYNLTGHETEEPVTFDDPTISRVVDFYERSKAVAPEYRPFHNCHLLGWYALGAVQELKPYTHYDENGISAQDTLRLQAGQAYITNNGNHTVLGIDRPAYNLSVLGDYSPLVISRNKDIARAYGSTGLRHVIPARAVQMSYASV